MAPDAASNASAIEGCKVFLVLGSPYADASAQLMNELHFAARCGKRIVVVWLAGFTPVNLTQYLGSAYRVDYYLPDHDSRLWSIVGGLALY
jgi:hypothetical protein